MLGQVPVGPNRYCYLIIRNAEVSLVEIESTCDQYYKRMLLFYAPTGEI